MNHDSLTPARALLLGFPLALFIGALLSDIAYYRSFDIQWANFASWLNAFGLLFGGIVLLIAAIDVVTGNRRGRSLLYLLLVAAMVVIGFVSALIHARDGWAAMPAALILSAIVAIVALTAMAVGLSGQRRVEAN